MDLKKALLERAKYHEGQAKAFFKAAAALVVDGVVQERRATKARRREAKTEIRRKGHTLRECQYRECKRKFRGHVDQKFCSAQHGSLERHALRRDRSVAK